MVDKKSPIRKLFPLLLIVVAIVLINTPTILNETEYIDYSDPSIKEVAMYIESISNSSYSEIVNTANYVYDQINYNYTGALCVGETASSVLLVGEGNCVSTSKLSAAILSALDFPVKIVDGCIFDVSSDRQTNFQQVRPFSIVPDSNSKIPILFSNNRESQIGGQVHSWVRAYSDGIWYTVETTAGVVFPTVYEKSYGFDTHSEDVDATNPYELCYLQDNDYIDYCRSG